MHWIHSSTQNPHLTDGFCHYSRSLQQFVDNEVQLPGLSHWSHSAGCTPDLFQTHTDISSTGYVKTIGRMVGGVPSCSSESSPNTSKQTEWECVVMLQDYLLLPRTTFTNCTTKLLQHLKATSSNDGPLVAKIWPIWILQHPENTVPMALWDKGIIFNLSPPPPAMLYGVILCSVVSLQDQSDETIFCHLSWCSDKSHCLQEHTVSAIVKKYFRALVHTSPASNELSKDKPSSNPDSPPFPELCSALFWSLPPFFTLSCTDSLWWANWFFLCLPWQRQFTGDYYGADWKRLFFHL